MKKFLLPAIIAALSLAPGLASAQYYGQYGQQYSPYSNNYGGYSGYQSAAYNPFQYSYNPYQSFGQFGYGAPYSGYGYNSYTPSYQQYSYPSYGYNYYSPIPPQPGTISSSFYNNNNGNYGGWVQNPSSSLGSGLCYGIGGSSTGQEVEQIRCQLLGGIWQPNYVFAGY